MSDQNNASDSGSPHVQVDVGQISASGHVVIAGGNATVSGDTHHEANVSQKIVVGGVTTTKQQYETLLKSIEQIEAAIRGSNLPDDQVEAAIQNAATLKTQLTSPQKPNVYLLAQAAQILTKFGKRVTTAVLATFANPLVGQILLTAGEKALEFYRNFRGNHSG